MRFWCLKNSIKAKNNYLTMRYYY